MEPPTPPQSPVEHAGREDMHAEERPTHAGERGPEHAAHHVEEHREPQRRSPANVSATRQEGKSLIRTYAPTSLPPNVMRNSAR